MSRSLVWPLIGAAVLLGVICILCVRNDEESSVSDEKSVGSDTALIKDVGRTGRQSAKAEPKGKQALLREKFQSRKGKPGRTDRSADGKRDFAAKAADLFEELPPAERKIAVAVQEALDDDDFQKILGPARKALASANPELRKHAVESLSWFGEKALPEITPLMADPNPEVAEAALDTSEDIVLNMEDHSLRFDAAAEYMKVFSSNEDVLSTFSGALADAANDLIEPEDPDRPADVAKAAENRQHIVETLSEMIDGGGKMAEECRDAYNFITGEEWINSEEAAKWAADPENYEAPDVP